MRYLMFYTPDPKRMTAPPTPEAMEAMGKFIEQSFKSGELIATGGLCAVGAETTGRVQVTDGELSITDGPFAESKEMIGGFALIRASSRAGMVDMTKRFLKVAGDGKCEFRQLDDNSPDNVGPVKS